MIMRFFLWGSFLLMLGAFGGGFLLGQNAVTGQVIEESRGKTYSWTTAICNDDHQCIDVLVQCVDGKVDSMTPVSNLTSFSETWEDPRDEAVVFCE
jgi:hypothetical protein